MRGPAGSGGIVHVAQLGARLNYAVPIALAQRGLLGRFYTDIWLDPASSPGRLVARIRFGPMARIAGRYSTLVPPRRVVSNPTTALLHAAYARASSSLDRRGRANLWASRALGRTFAERYTGGGRVLYGHSGAALWAFRVAKTRGLQLLLEQTGAPPPIEWRIRQRERERFVGWEPAIPVPESWHRYWRAQQAEWRMADTIICASEFVRGGIATVGGPVEKCVVLPYGLPAHPPSRPRAPHAPLRLLMLGNVTLQKGVQYLWLALQKTSFPVDCRVVGKHYVSPKAVKLMSAHMTFVGAVPRAEVEAHLDWADALVFPSLCDGFGMSMLEALRAGIPVISTSSTGRVIRDDVEGIEVEPAATDELASAIDRLASDPATYQRLSDNAPARAASFSLDEYSNGLSKLVAGMLASA